MNSHLLTFRFDCEQHLHLLILSLYNYLFNSFNPLILTIFSKTRSRFKSNYIIFANKYMKSLLCKTFFLKTSELSVFHPFIYPVIGYKYGCTPAYYFFSFKFKTLLHPQEKVITDITPNLPLPPLFFFALHILESSTIYCCKQGKQNNSPCSLPPLCGQGACMKV